MLVGTDNGLWEIDAAGTRALVEGKRISALSGAWVIADGDRILKDGDEVARAPRRLECLCDLGGALLLGTDEAHLLRYADGRVETVSSFDQAPGRAEWYTPWGGRPDTRSIAAAGDVYVNVHVGGILVSRDGCRSFEPTAIDIDADVHQVLVHDGTVLAATADGLAVGDGAGDTWTFHTDGLHASYCRAVAVAGDTILLSASTGPHGGRGAVYRRTGDTFERTSGFIEGNIDTFCLVASGDRAAFGTEDGRVFASDDAGATWDEAASGLPSVLCLEL